ncbi:hypothetical protein LCGC14_0503950 [marine sediment metagenome]|uniref:Methyltransferase FkbM domain-containing protein n=1 Tax=marine sediment metagenome TaxID=412755 RepID=A0A0F9S301_9ZZZZ
MYNYNIGNITNVDELFKALGTPHGVEPLESTPFLHVWQDRDESKEFFRQVREYFNKENGYIANILEIGGHVGGHAVMLSTLIKDFGYMVVIEPELHKLFLRNIVKEVIRPKELIHLPFMSEDLECINIVADFVERRGLFQLIVADGAHSVVGVKADFLNYWPMLSSPGVFMIHDIGYFEVREAWEFIKNAGDYQTITIELYREREEQKGLETTCNGVGLIFKSG